MKLVKNLVLLVLIMFAISFVMAEDPDPTLVDSSMEFDPMLVDGAPPVDPGMPGGPPVDPSVEPALINSGPNRPDNAGMDNGNRKKATDAIKPVLKPDTANPCANKIELQTQILEVRYNFYYHSAERMRIRMEAMIEQLGANADTSTSELESIKDDFLALYDVAKDAVEAADHRAFNDAVKDGKDLIKKFREASASLITDKEAIKAALEEAMTENEDYLAELRNDALDFQLEHRLAVYSDSICHINYFIEQHNLTDNEEIKAKVEEIEEKYGEFKEALEAAYEECKLKRLAQCYLDEADEAIAVLREFKDDLVELRRMVTDYYREQRQERKQQKIQEGIDQLSERHAKAIEKVQETITKIAESDIDVSEIQALLDEAKAEFEEIINSIDVTEDLDLKALKESLKGSVDKLKEIGEKIKELLKEAKDALQVQKQVDRNNTSANATGARKYVNATTGAYPNVANASKVPIKTPIESKPTPNARVQPSVTRRGSNTTTTNTGPADTDPESDPLDPTLAGGDIQ